MWAINRNSALNVAFVNERSVSWRYNVCDWITGKYFSLVSTTWWQGLTNVEAQLRAEMLRLCLEMSPLQFCQDSRIRDEEKRIPRGKKHLWLWRAIQAMPAVLRGSALASSKGEPLNQHRFDWKHKQNQLTKIALSTAHKRDKNTFKSAWKVNEWACLLLTKIDDCTLKLGKL